MPIQIRELVVKVTVSEGANSPTQAGGSQAPISAPANSKLLQQCVEEVLEVLKRKKER